MSNFTRKIERANMLDHMAEQLKNAEATEARAVFIAACYEAVYGALQVEFLKAVQDLIKNEQPKTKGDFFNMVYGAAVTVHADMEYERAAAMVDARAEAAQEVVTPENTSSTESPAE